MGKLRLFLAALTAAMLFYDGFCVANRTTLSSRRFVQSGLASWYGCEEQGRRTADGETYNRHSFTAASRHLPFNTIVRVTNENNGRSVQVRINDRGPFVKDRILDLSEAAAETLDMKRVGTAPVKIEVIRPPSAPAPISP
jgi:rare lipoprotein A